MATFGNSLADRSQILPGVKISKSAITPGTIGTYYVILVPGCHVYTLVRDIEWLNLVLYTWQREKQFNIKNNYLYILTSLLGQKIHTDSKTSLKKSNTILQGLK